MGPRMSEIPVSDVRAAFAEVLNRVAYGKERVLITRHDHGVAALIPMEDLRRLETLDKASEETATSAAAPPVEEKEEAAPTTAAPKPQAAQTETVPDHILERIREEIYDRASREVYEQVHDEASRKLAAMMRPRSG